MTNCRLVFNTISLLVLLSLTVCTNGINSDDQHALNANESKWTDRNSLLKYGSVVGLVCLISLAMVYTVLHYRRRYLLAKQNENPEDKEKGTTGNALDELFKSTASDDDKCEENEKRNSFPTDEDQRTAKVHRFLMRAMTLPQSVMQTVGKIQTVQITEPSANVEQAISSKNQPNSVTSSTNSPTGNSSSLISTTCTPTQIERPANIKTRPTAVKSPSSNYLKKSPSPTGQKSPPQTDQTNTDKQEAQSAIKSDDTPSTSRDQDTSSMDNQSSRPELDDSYGEFRLGKLQFCLKYNYEKHAISVSMIKCMNLPGKNTMNTYVKLQLLPEKKHKVKTRTIRKNQNPSYQEDFTFFNIQPQQLDNLALHFIIMSFDRYSRDEVLGEVLHPCRDQFDTIEKQISLTLDINPKGLLSKAQGRGEILLSLCYHRSSALLSLVVLKAKNLQKSNTGFPDPYVKINLYINNKRVSKKKTHSKKSSLNPIYNEIFSFDLSTYLTNEMSESNDDNIDLSVWENIKLELIVVDYDRITRNENIGCLTLCINDQDANVRKHMKDMLLQPRKQIACWHKLREI